MTIEKCREACRHNSACTGIQYSAKNPNCDLIVIKCDFDHSFKKSSRHEWLAESRTCFDHGPKPDPPAAPCFSSKVSNVDACGFSNKGLSAFNNGKANNGKGMTIEKCREACRHNSACTGIQYSYKHPNCDLIVEKCDFNKKFKKSSSHEWLAESRTCFEDACFSSKVSNVDA